MREADTKAMPCIALRRSPKSLAFSEGGVSILKSSSASATVIILILASLVSAMPASADPVGPPQDYDGDGYVATEDCNDNDASISPGAAEIPGNYVDENCDGVAEGQPMPDYVVASTSTSANPSAGTPFEVYVEVQNVGNADGSWIYAHLYQDCIGCTWLGYREMFLAAGNSAVFTYGVTIQAEGTATLVVRADTWNYVSESEESNNEVSFSVLVGPPQDIDGDGYHALADCNDNDASISPGATEIPGNYVDEDCDGIAADQPAPDYAITSMSTTADPTAGTPFDVMVHVENLGNADGSWIYVHLYQDCIGCNWLGYRETYVPAGSAADLTYTVDIAQEGEITLVARADTWNYVSESDEGNNEVSMTVLLGAPIDADGDGYHALADCNDGDAAISPGATEIPGNYVDEDCDGIAQDQPMPDYVVTSVTTSPNPTAGTPFEIYVEAANQGNADGSWIYMHLYRDCFGCTWLGYRELYIPAGSSALSTFSVTLGEGVWDLYVKPDSWNYVSESNEDNNLYVFQLGQAPPTDADNDGWDSSSDCNDSDANIHPGAYDSPANGVDEDCDGADATGFQWYGYSPSGGPIGTEVTLYGSGFSSLQTVLFGGSSVGFTIVDDGLATFVVPAYPADNYSIEVQDNAGSSAWTCCFSVTAGDADGDGYDASSDCDDADAAIHPNAWDTPYDGVDQDCTGMDSVIPSGFRSDLTFRDYYWNAHDGATFGVEDGSTSGYDFAYDAAEPPAPPAQRYVRAYFVDNDELAPGDALSTSVVPGASTLELTLRLEWSNEWCCESYYLDWNDLSAWLPKEYNAYIIDGNNVYSMRYAGSTGLYAGSQVGSKDVRIVLSADVVATSLYLPYGWSLVSIPVQTTDMSVAGLFGSYADAVYTWDDGSYQTVSTLETGKGYWVHNVYGWTSIPLIGIPVREQDVALDAGYNLVGAPFGGDVISGEHVSATGFYWSGGGSGGGYYATSWLNQGYGTWVYAAQPTSIHLGFGSPNARVDVERMVSQLSPEDAVATPFELAIALDDSSDAMDGATLVTRSDARAGFDAELDVMEAPRPAASVWTQAYFVSGSLQQDTAAMPTAAQGTYKLEIARSGPAGTVTLSWADAELPEDLVFELVDGETRVDMREATSYTFAVGAGLTTTQLHVAVRSADGPLCVLAHNDACLAALPFDPLARL